MFFRKYILNKYNIVRLIVAFVIGVTISILNVASYNGWTTINCYKDGLFLGAFVCVLLAFLSILSNFGTFDIFSFFPGRKRTSEGRKESYPEYAERKKGERDTSKYGFIMYFVVALFLCICACICLMLS